MVHPKVQKSLALVVSFLLLGMTAAYADSSSPTPSYGGGAKSSSKGSGGSSSGTPKATSNTPQVKPPETIQPAQPIKPREAIKPRG